MSASVIFFLCLLPSNSSSSVAPDPAGLPGAKLTGEEKGEEIEGVGGQRREQAPGLSQRPRFQRLPPPTPSGVELQKLPLPRYWPFGVKEEGSETLRMRTVVSFLSLVPCTPTLVPPRQSSAHVPLHSVAGEPVTQPCSRRRGSRLKSLLGLGGGGRTRLTALTSAGFLPFPPRLLPALPGSLRPCGELLFTDARLKGAGRPHPLSPLASSAFWAGWGEGRGGSLPIPHILEAEASKVGYAQRAISTPFGPVLQVSSGSGRRGPGCLGGRPRVT